MLPDFETLVKEIKAKRKDLGWSQKGLANRAGVSQSLVAKLEQRMNVPNYKSVRKIHAKLREHMKEQGEDAGDLLNPEIISVEPSDTRERAAGIMKENDFSQLPVKDGEDYVGIVLSKDIGLAEDEALVEDIMQHTAPMVPENASRKALVKLLETNSAVLVKGKEGNVKGIVTPADLL